MKIKLLKKLKKRFELHQRNGKFKVFDNYKYVDDVYRYTNWIDKKEAFKIRRQWILEEAQNYITFKNQQQG